MPSDDNGTSAYERPYIGPSYADMPMEVSNMDGTNKKELYFYNFT